MKKIALTGIKPTGTPHIGNYLGMILPALELANRYRAFYFLADYHALTTIKDRSALQHFTYDVAATWLALGLNPESVIFYRQSDIPEVFELAWILSCFTPKGVLNRAHAYKAAIKDNIDSGKSPDTNINTGLFHYPVLMAADILLPGTQVVPVGLDQKQHVEIARDIAVIFNNQYQNVLTLPEPMIREAVQVIPGIDGHKMSKNYQNTIPIFTSPQQRLRQVMKIVTDSKRAQDPKDPEKCNIFAIYQHFAPPEAVADTRRRYLKGGVAYNEMKQRLFDLLEDRFGEPRKTYDALMKNWPQIDLIFAEGALKARAICRPMMERIRKIIGKNGTPFHVNNHLIRANSGDHAV